MKKNQGFSLIELIIYMGLTATLISVMSQVFIATLGLRLESENTTSVQQDGRFIMAKINYDVRRAKTIVSPLWGEASSSMTLIIPELGSDHTYQYAWSGNTLTLTDGANASLLNSDRTVITNFSVTHVGQSATAAGMISLSLGLSGNTQVTSGQQSLDLHSTVGQR